MSADRTVRPARPGDASAVGAVQGRAWREAYGGLLPSDVLDELSAPALAEVWREAIVSPPTPRHHVLVASGTVRPTAGTADASDADEIGVVGFAALAPGGDDDLDAVADAELLALVIDPDRMGQGHGSRLLQAAAELLRTDGATRAFAWVNLADTPLITFLEGAGWGADGARRSLDLRGDGALVVDQVRLATQL